MRFIELSFFVLFTGFLVSCESREAKLTREGNALAKEIENYKKQNHRYPRSLTEIGIEVKQEGPLYYELRDSSYFVIYFGTALGESRVYHSKINEWTDYAY